MESAAIEPSRRGLRAALAKARRSGKDTSSTPSINGTDNSSEGHGIRTSIDSTRDQSGGSRKSSVDDGTTLSKTRKLTNKLLPKSIVKKLKGPEEFLKQGGESEQFKEYSGGNSKPGAGPAGSKDHQINVSQTSKQDDDRSSLITFDSNSISPLGSPPPLMSHPSHVGYLTSTSPLIKTSNVVTSSSSLQLNHSSTIPPQDPNSNSISAQVGDHSSSSDLAPQNAVKSDPQQNERLLGATDPADKKRRGISPGTKLKSALTSGSRKADSSPPTSPELTSVRSSGGENISGGRSGGDKSIAGLRQGSSPDTAMASTRSNKVGISGISTNSRDLPSPVTTPTTPPSTAIEAPHTTVTPPTPTDLRLGTSAADFPRSQNPGKDSNTITPASGNTVSHRRVRSDSAAHAPSKLSNAISAPLTPTPEESKSLGARTPLSQNSVGGSGGFLSSVFSLAQNATNTLTNSLANNNTNPQKPRNSTLTFNEDDSRELESLPVTTNGGDEVPIQEKRTLAIDTLGTGDLSLSHLGITPDVPMSGNSTTGNFPTVADGLPENIKVATSLQRDEAAARVEDVAAARAVSAAYSEKMANENSTPIAEDTPKIPTKLAYEPSVLGDRTPPNGSVFEGDQGTRRSGSVRSRVGAVTRRHRNSSSATGNTVGTVGTLTAASQSTIGNLAGTSSTPKLTGFAVATKKRNRDFHQLFRSIPEDDYLIEDYSCALQRDIIIAGRVYISESHICFSSNILGWITTLIISFDEIVSVEKENTAMVFPNAIAIQTLHARQTFRSLLSREATYELIIGIWKLSHPSLKSSLNGVHLDAGGTGDKTEKVDPIVSDDQSDLSEEEEEIYDEDEVEDEGIGSFTEAGNVSVEGSEDNDLISKSTIRKASAMGLASGSAAGGVPTTGEGRGAEKAAAAAAASADFPGPATHAPTECSDADTHYDRVIKDEIIPAPLGKVYSMIFGPASGGFMTRWFIDDQKMMDLQMEDDKKGLSEEHRARTYSYIKPLYASIGPKQTKCLITETLDFIDLEKAVSVTVATQTPDVPNGNMFTTKTKFCLSWGPNNSTRIFINCTIEWTGKSWLKGPIEKGANEGQSAYATDLVKALNAGVKSRSRAATTSSKLKAKVRRRKGDAGTPKKLSTDDSAKASSPPPRISRWGVLEPLHDTLSPVIDILAPLITPNVIISSLLILLILTWLRIPSSPSRSLAFSSPERMAAYEEIWRREESSLWDWLEERIRLDVTFPSADDRDRDREAVLQARKRREESLRAQRAATRLEGEGMSAREVDEAIRVTEERLGRLKRAVQRKRAEGPRA